MSPTAIVVSVEPWAKQLQRLLSGESVDVLLFEHLAEVPTLVRERRVALVTAAPHLGLTECLAIQQLRELMPAMALVLCTATRAARFDPDQTVRDGSTVIVAWPPNTELLHQMLRRWSTA